MKTFVTLIAFFIGLQFSFAQKAKTPKPKKAPVPIHEEFFKKSKFILEAEPISYKSYFTDKDTNEIYTSISLKVYKVYKGRLTSDTIELVRKGGEINYNHTDIKKDRCQLWLTGKYILFCTKSLLPVDPRKPKSKKPKTILTFYKDIPDGVLSFSPNKQSDYYVKGFNSVQFKSIKEFHEYIKKIPGVIIPKKA